MCIKSRQLTKWSLTPTIPRTKPLGLPYSINKAMPKVNEYKECCQKTERKSTIIKALWNIRNGVYKILDEAHDTSGIPWSTLGHWLPGNRKSCTKTHQNQQILPHRTEKAIVYYCKQLNDRKFPLPLDILRADVNGIAKREAEQGIRCGRVGKVWSTRFLCNGDDTSVGAHSCSVVEEGYNSGITIVKTWNMWLSNNPSA